MADQWARMNNYIRERSEKIAARAAISAGQSAIFKSPVATGLFINNWFTEVNGISDRISRIEDENASSRLGDLNTKALSISIGDSISFVNNLPYAIPLEYGHSQKGSAMIRLTVQEWPLHITAAVRSLDYD